jgi:hypothetical protein
MSEIVLYSESLTKAYSAQIPREFRPGQISSQKSSPAQAKAEQLFGGMTTGIKSGDQFAQRIKSFNLSIPIDSTKAVYSRKRRRNIPHEIGCLMHRMADWRSLPDDRTHALKILNEDLIGVGTAIVAMADQLLLSMGIFPWSHIH